MEGDGDTVYCELKYSGLGMALLLGACAATIALVAALPWPMPFRGAALAWTCAASSLACRSLCAACALRLEASRRIVVGDRAGEVLDGCFVAPWLTVIRWRPEGARFGRSLVLLPDALDARAMRKIRVILRWA